MSDPQLPIECYTGHEANVIRLDTLEANAGKRMQRGSFSYFIHKVDEGLFELHTYRVIAAGAQGHLGVGVKGFVLVACGEERGHTLALPYILMNQESYTGDMEEDLLPVPVLIDRGFNDLEGSLDALEQQLCDDEYVESLDGDLDYELERITHAAPL